MRAALLLAVAVTGCASSSSSPATIAPDSDAGFYADGAPRPNPNADGGEPGPGPAVEPNASGSRIKARSYVGSDGSRQFIGWRDSQANEDCGYQKAADGKLRCLPLGSGALSLGYFTEGGCSQPLIVLAKGCAAPKYALEPLTGGAACTTAGVRVKRFGTPYAGTTAYTGSPGSCAAVAPTTFASLKATWDLYGAPGAEVPPNTYVEATEKVD